MRYSSRLFLYAPIFVLLVLAIAAVLRWQTVAGGLESWLKQHNGREIAPGVTLRFAGEQVGGFPFNVDAVLRDVTIDAKSEHTSGSWHTDAFAIHELTFGRTQQVYEAAGKQTVSWTDAEGGAHRLAFVPGSLQASAIQSRGRLVRFDLDINGIGSREILGARLQLHFRKAPDRDAIDFAASADQLHLAPALEAGFGPELHSARISGSLAPAAPFAALSEGRDTWDKAFEAWRQHGGTLHLDGLDMDWNRVQLHADGRLALDDVHRPLGTLALAVNGVLKAPAAGTADDRFARALLQLLPNVTNDSRKLTIDIASGNINLRVIGAAQYLNAGSLGPLY